MALIVSSALPSCASTNRNRAWVSRSLSKRTGFSIAKRDAGYRIPKGVQLSDGLDENEAVAIALYRSPRYRAELEKLGIAHGDLEDASRIDNPRFGILGPVGVIAGWATLAAPLDSLIQMPSRTEAASREIERVAEALLQSGLDLARDARLAHIERMLAEKRLTIRQELASTAADIARIVELRAAAGDVSPADPLSAHAEAAIAEDTAAVAKRDIAISAARLATILGFDPDRVSLKMHFGSSLPKSAPPLEDLLAIARKARPDLLAAKLNIEAAAARAGIERARIVSISAQIDGQWNAQNNKVGTRIGANLMLPIFNQNQGGRERADAGIEQARHEYIAARQRVISEVIVSNSALKQALASLERYRVEVLPALEQNLHAAKLSYELGDQPYLVVLDALRRLGEARIREVELVAEARRAHAELERTVGARLKSNKAAASMAKETSTS
ncbi:MAG: TolC family protein [Myxococcales bacterium]|nr:MAG: TolC family protein [Myxococcales bacterium]